MRKTLIGALASALLLIGFAGQAAAQDDTTVDTTADTTVDTTTDTTVDTTVDTTTDTTADTTVDTTTDTTADTTTEAATDTTVAGTGDSAGTSGQTGSSVADAFAPETPNPQPGVSTEVDDVTAQDVPATPEVTADEVLGETQLALTGPDTRVMALAVVLLSAGALFIVASRRQRDELLPVNTWLD